MAEYIVQGESLTAVADEIRVLSGTEDNMGLDAMATHVREANRDIAAEANLITQIQMALEGKTGVSGIGSFQKKTGTLTTTNGSASVECGFQPDAVEIVITSGNFDSTYGTFDTVMSAVFSSESSATKYVAANEYEYDYPNGYCMITRTATGFAVSEFKWYTDLWEKQVDDGSSYEYTAIKYTYGGGSSSTIDTTAALDSAILDQMILE